MGAVCSRQIYHQVQLDPFPYDKERGSTLRVFISKRKSSQPYVYADIVLGIKQQGNEKISSYCGEGSLSCSKEKAYKLVEEALIEANCPVWLSEAVVETAASGYTDQTFSSPSSSPFVSEE